MRARTRVAGRRRETKCVAWPPLGRSAAQLAFRRRCVNVASTYVDVCTVWMVVWKEAQGDVFYLCSMMKETMSIDGHV